MLVPLIAYTDIVSGPTTGGENNKGIYLSIFGRNFGAADSLGRTTKVYLGGIEVDNYRFLGLSRGRKDIQQIAVQIGALGNARSGSVLPVKVVVEGRESNTDFTFTVLPGSIFFVDSAKGIDTADISTGGTYLRPFRTVQKPGIGLAFSIQPASTAGAYGRIRAGDVIVMRGGAYSEVGFGGTGGRGYFMQALNKSGCAIGVICARGGGASSGPITIMGYPGEDVFIDRSNKLGSDQFGGGFSSADRARQADGAGAWFTIANLRIESGFNDGPINVQNGNANPSGSHWRIVNNEMTSFSCQINSKCRAAGAAGSGNGNYWVGNHVHDMYDMADGITDLENHGFYVGGPGSYEIAFNTISKIRGGNGIQIHDPGAAVDNVNIHHNLIFDIGKHGLNIADGAHNGILIYNNVIYETDMAAIRFNARDLIHTAVYNNTFFRTDMLDAGGVLAAVMNDAKSNPGAIEFRNNIVVPGKTRRNYLGGAAGLGSAKGTMSHNLWFNGRGITIGENIASDPLFVSIDTGFMNLSLRNGSPAIDSGTSALKPLVENDFQMSSRPVGGGIDIGAYEFFK